MAFLETTSINPTSDDKRSELFSVCEIRPWLFIGAYRALRPYPTKIKQLGFTHAVDVTNIISRLHYQQRHSDVKYFDVKIDDSEWARIDEYFEKAVNYIRNAKDSGGKILVYCQQAISRSATICVISLMMIEDLSLYNAFIEVQKCRPIISPNIGFWRQMIEYEKVHRGSASVTLIQKENNRIIPDVYLHKNSDKSCDT